MDDFDQRCVQPEFLPPLPTEPLAPAIYPSAVYRCRDTAQAQALMAGELAGYVYGRESHPNATLLAQRCRSLHAAEAAVICCSGMAALSAALLATVKQGDHVLDSSRLYGQSSNLLVNEAARLGIESTVVDTCDLVATAAALRQQTRLLVVETLTNPTLRLHDLAAVAAMARARGITTVADNTFCTPCLVRPLECGIDLVMHSMTKYLGGHGDATPAAGSGCPS